MGKHGCRHDCRFETLGLDEDDSASLTGFTSRAFAALAHLREAWLVADDSNAHAIEAALREMMRGHSFADHTGLVRQILCYSHERGAELIRAVFGPASVIEGGM